MDVRVLGTVSVWKGDEEVPTGPRKQRTVLALIVAGRGRPISTDSLIMGLYGPDASTGSKRTIHTYVSNLRRALGDVIQATGQGYALAVEPECIDAVRFERLATEGAELVDQSPETASTLLRAALSLWRGHAYEGIDVHESLGAERARLHQLRVAALEERIAADIESGRHRRLLGELEALSAEHPLNERIRGLQMLALYRSGRQAESLRVFARTRELLANELGLDPSPELQDLEYLILTQDPSLNRRPTTVIERFAVLVADVDEAVRLAPTRALDDVIRMRNETLRSCAQKMGGSVLAIRGAAVVAAFPRTSDASRAAGSLMGMQARIAIDFGDVESTPNGPSGPSVTRASRVAAVGHADQVLLTDDAQAALAAEGGGGWALMALGTHPIRGIDRPIPLFQLVGDGIPQRFPPPELDRLPPPMHSESAAVTGYELRDVIGDGMLGRVHLAYQPSIGREVAIRVVRPDLVSDTRFVRRFEAVAQRVAAIEHPHLLPLLDYWREPDQAFLVHRLMRSPTLRDRLITDGSTPEASGSMLSRIVSGLTVAHEHGIAHGRLCPENIFIGDEDALYVADLGLAAMFDGMIPSRANPYTAPEVVGGASPTSAGDVYSLGVMACEAISGRPPGAGRPLTEPQSPLEHVIDRATAARPDERYASLDEFLDDLAIAASGMPQPRRAGTTSRRPYKGLAAFREADARDFFGRTQLIEQLADCVGNRPFTMVAGPSGVGKSSAVRAGLTPIVRNESGRWQGWLITDMVPGSEPFEELERALSRVAVDSVAEALEPVRNGSADLGGVARFVLPPGAKLLLIIDQFEEIFSYGTSEEAVSRFLEVIAQIGRDSSSSIHVVATMRADFLDRPLLHPEFGELVTASTVMVRSLNADELREAIREPAAGVNVDIEPALVEAMTAEAVGQPGTLPLVQQTLTDLFAGRREEAMTLEAYQAMGGLGGAIGRSAELTFSSIDPAHREVARELFLQLVNVSPDSPDTRRRVRRTELAHLRADPGGIDDILEAFGAQRLLTFDFDPASRIPTVELAHEALLIEWERLTAWIAEARDDLHTARRLDAARSEWERSGGDAAYLLTGARLEQASEWLSTSPLPASDAIGAYVQRSMVEHRAKVSRRRRRRQAVTGGFAVAALVSSTLALAAWSQRQDARRQAELSTANALVLEARGITADDPELGSLLALEAIDIFERNGNVPASAVTALRGAVTEDRVLARFPGGRIASASRDGSMFATAAESGGVTLWDPETGRLVDTITGSDGDGEPIDALFSQTEDELFVRFSTGETTSMRALDLETGRWSDLPGRYDVPEHFDVDGISSNGRYRFGMQNGRLTVLERSTGVVLAEVAVPADPTPAAMSDDGLVAFVDPNALESQIIVMDVAGGRTILTVPGEMPRFSPEGDRLAVAGRRFVSVYDLTSGVEEWTVAHSSVAFPRWMPDGDVLVTGGDGPMTLFDAATGEVLDVISSHEGGTFDYAGIPGTDLLVSGGPADALALLVDASPSGPGEIGSIPIPFAFPTVSVSGDELFVTQDEQFAVVDLTSGQLVTAPTPGGLVAAGNSRLFLQQNPTTGGAELRSGPGDSPVYQPPPGYDVAAVSDDGLLALLFALERPIELIRVADGHVLWRADAGEAAGIAAFTSNAQYVVTHSSFPNGSWMDIWRVADGRRMARYPTGIGHDIIGGLALAFSSDDSRLVIGGYDGEVDVLDFELLLTGVPPGEAMMSFPAHDNVIDAVTVSPDMRYIATRAGGEPVRLFDAGSGRLLSELGPPSAHSAWFHPSKPWLYVGHGRSITIHTLEFEELVSIARSRLTRDLTPEECLRYLGEPCR